MTKTTPPTPDGDLGARLKKVRAKLGLTGEEVARRLEISRPYWSALENGKRPPGRKLLAAIERVFGVRPDYLIGGSGAMFHRVAETSQQVDERSPRPATPLTVGEARVAWPGVDAGEPLVLALSTGPGNSVRRYEVLPRIGPLQPSARRGRGAAAAMDRAGDFAFSLDWLRDNLGHTSGRLATLQVDGDAMLPSLHDGDTVVIDTGVHRVEASGVYVIALHGDRLVRRIQRMLDDSLLIMSDNPAYGKETVPPARAKALEVVGRVVWPRMG
jgi:phage repressor protein C with HTH and peptisase S24 domain